ncbi:TIGR02530 family flagellar biosynthesis protein [Brevibacillus dissolubilis]|uniref:TIGR02530 family flagellar biosynthesis protein n=1 Tax=Brevibacillus dissolubilis TaxID=1844116 RepID=UPI0011175D17|nr:TIGR02530 family flagellar biosynthesis protein [Brevibacillus dissolubilis]
MNQQFRVGQTYFPSRPHGVTKQPQNPQTVQKPFDDWLHESLKTNPAKTQAISFSQHALNRLKERGIQLGEAELARLEGGVKKAAGKGARESLILMDNVAYVVSITNRKVITAVDDANMKDNVFTNIDSAVFV